MEGHTCSFPEQVEQKGLNSRARCRRLQGPHSAVGLIEVVVVVVMVQERGSVGVVVVVVVVVHPKKRQMALCYYYHLLLVLLQRLLLRHLRRILLHQSLVHLGILQICQPRNLGNHPVLVRV